MTNDFISRDLALKILSAYSDDHPAAGFGDAMAVIERVPGLAGSPRLITYAELVTLSRSEVPCILWEEVLFYETDGEIFTPVEEAIPCMLSGGKIIDADGFNELDGWIQDEYGESVRFWTAKPGKLLQESTPWRAEA